MGDVFHDHLLHHGRQLLWAVGARQDRPTIDHYPMRQAGCTICREVAAQGNAPVLPRCWLGGWYLFDGELRACELAAQVSLQPIHGSQKQLIELLRTGACPR